MRRPVAEVEGLDRAVQRPVERLTNRITTCVPQLDEADSRIAPFVSHRKEEEAEMSKLREELARHDHLVPTDVRVRWNLTLSLP